MLDPIGLIEELIRLFPKAQPTLEISPVRGWEDKKPTNLTIRVSMRAHMVTIEHSFLSWKLPDDQENDIIIHTILAMMPDDLHAQG